MARVRAIGRHRGRFFTMDSQSSSACRRHGPSFVHGHFTGDPYPLDPPEYGCHLAIGYELDGYIPSQRSAPLLSDHLSVSVKQGSYRGLNEDELRRLVAAIRAHSAYVAL